MGKKQFSKESVFEIVSQDLLNSDYKYGAPVDKCLCRNIAQKLQGTKYGYYSTIFKLITKSIEFKTYLSGKTVNKPTSNLQKLTSETLRVAVGKINVTGTQILTNYRNKASLCGQLCKEFHLKNSLKNRMKIYKTWRKLTITDNKGEIEDTITVENNEVKQFSDQLPSNQQVRGVDREICKKSILKTKPFNYKKNTLINASKLILKEGKNLQNVKSDNTLRKIRSEALSQLDRDRDDLIDMIMMQNDHPEYIKEVSVPFNVKLFSIEQVNVLKWQSTEKDLPLIYFDATGGSVLRTPQTELALATIKATAQKGPTDTEKVQSTENTLSDLPGETTTTLHKASPFYKRYLYLTKNITMEQIGTEKNIFYNKEFMDIILNKYLPFCSLYTGLMLNNSPVSNALVENYFGQLKQITLEGQKNLK
ncbi:hypothetical protein QE152_g38069 [Popillia japonica]|uniref:Uncharacterized protein n=1 Tax=Popillia japonica TaxID=7064 RepID=A0AAW1I8X2_POPJA